VKCIDDEIQFEIPVGWEWCRINDLFLHSSGKQQSSSNKNGGTPQKFITTSNLYWGFFALDNVKVMNFTEEEIKTCSATKGDLLVCEGGAGYGRSAIWDNDYDICLQNHIHRLRPLIVGTCDYVYYVLFLLKESNNLASVGTAMPGLSANRLKNLLIPLPPLAEQKKIVARIEKLLPLVEKYREAQERLDKLNSTINETLKKSILQEAIQGKLVPQIESEGTAQELLEQIRAEKQRLVKEGKLKKSALTDSTIFRGDDNRHYEKIGKTTRCIEDEIPFEIPESWRWTRMKDICIYLHRGKSPKYGLDKSLPIIAQKCNQWDGLYIDRCLYSDPTFISRYSEEQFLQVGDILINSTGGGTVGRTGIVPKSIFTQSPRFVADSHVTVVRLADGMIPQYIYAYLVSPLIQVGIEDRCSGSTNQIELGTATIGNYLVPVPSTAEQSRIAKRIDELFAIISK